MIRAALIVAVSLLQVGCITLPRYIAAEPRYLTSPDESELHRSVAVYLEPVYVGKRFDEVVCDNVVGAIWNPEESNRIGFTQEYSSVLPTLLLLTALEARLPYNIGIGRVASGQSMVALDRVNVDSRIMVPFGNYISRNVEQLLRTQARNSAVCFDTQCIETRRLAGSLDLVATVRFTRFKVAEERRNTLTLAVEAVVSVESVSSTKTWEYRISEAIQDRSITSEGYFHSDALRVMNRTANEISSAIARQVLAGLR